MPRSLLRKLKKRFTPTETEAFLREQRRHGTFVFIHINKCGGTSVEKALGLPKIHDTALERIARIGRDRWDAMHSFTIVRHPYEKVASHYRHRVKTAQTGLGDRHIGLNEWVKEAYGAKDPRYYDKPLMFAPCLDWITDRDGTVLVDQILKLETIGEDWPRLQEATGITAEMQHQNRTVHREPDLDEDAREIIARHFRKDFDAFGYTA